MVQINGRPEGACQKSRADFVLPLQSESSLIRQTQGVALGYYVSCAFSAQKAMRKAEERSYAKSPRIKTSQPPSNSVTEISQK
jgi:hypothetical protein